MQTKPWSVGVVGAGPAGLACADVLSRNGISVTVYDRYPEIGGLLSFGIPDFKLELKVMRRRREVPEAAVVLFRLNCEIGRDIQAHELEKMHDALFFGTGTYTPVQARLPGIEKGGIVINGTFRGHRWPPCGPVAKRSLCTDAPVPRRAGAREWPSAVLCPLR